MSIAARLLEHSVVYRAWQAPFAARKLAPVFAHNDRGRIRRVLDVACGPGTNTSQFAGVQYLGIDINERYIESARRRYGREFIAADVTRYQVDVSERFDFILVNSLLHHLDTGSVRRLLSHLSGLLTEDGHVHVLDLVLPDRRGIARSLARLDRGDYARPLPEWSSLLSEHFEPVLCLPYELALGGVPLWHMLYFKGRARQS